MGAAWCPTEPPVVHAWKPSCCTDHMGNTKSVRQQARPRWQLHCLVCGNGRWLGSSWNCTMNKLPDQVIVADVSPARGENISALFISVNGKMTFLTKQLQMCPGAFKRCSPLRFGGNLNHVHLWAYKPRVVWETRPLTWPSSGLAWCSCSGLGELPFRLCPLLCHYRGSKADSPVHYRTWIVRCAWRGHPIKGPSGSPHQLLFITDSSPKSSHPQTGNGEEVLSQEIPGGKCYFLAILKTITRF